MLRNRLFAAACATALMTAPALAQEAVQDPPATTEAPAEMTAEADAETPDVSGNVVQQLRASGQFTTLLTALDAAGLTATLESDPDITILAPTDAAFAALPAGELDRLTDEANREELQQLLLYHVINADVSTDDLANRRGAVATAEGTQVLLDGGNGTLRADAGTLSAEIDASNGAVFPVDRVLMPSQSMAGQGDVEAEAEVDADAEAGAVTDDTTAADTVPAETVGAEVMGDDTPAGDEPMSAPVESAGEPMPTTPPTAPEPTEPVAEDPATDNPVTPDA